MLTPELIKKIKRIHVAGRRAVDTVMAGQYRSAFRGAGIEFEEVREYTPGDEIKSIDWKVTARMGRPYVKLYREERELIIMLMVDMSASGLFGTGDNLKREASCEIAAILAFNAIRNNDKIGAILFTDRVERYIPPKKGASHVWRVIKEILSFVPEHRGTDISSSADFLAKVSRKRTVSFIISDFLSSGYIDSLKRANRKHDCIAAVVSDPGDFTLPDAGILEAEDLETGARFFIDCSDKNMRGTYIEARRKAHRHTLEELKRAKIDSIALSTDSNAAEALYTFFRYRERRIK